MAETGVKEAKREIRKTRCRKRKMERKRRRWSLAW
jgi:hypothetical protein